MVVRGEIWLVALDPTVGSQIRTSRPRVVVSPPEMHDFLRTALVAPMTTQSRPAPFRIPLAPAAKKGLILLDQIRAVDQVRLTKKLGTVSAKTREATLGTLQEVFAR